MREPFKEYVRMTAFFSGTATYILWSLGIFEFELGIMLLALMILNVALLSE